MKKITPQSDWLESWNYSYKYDLLEIYGDLSNLGYAYAYTNRFQHTLSFVQQVAPPGAKILDVAAAQGNFSLALAELGYIVTWNDLRSELIDYVKLKWEKGTINFAPGNVFTLDFPDSFDIILILEVIEHVAHPDDFLKKISTLVKPGGYIIMSTPNGEYIRNRLPKFSDCQDPSQFESIQFKPDSDGHIFLLHLDEVYSLAHQAGLTVQKIQLFNNPLTSGYMKMSSLLKILPRPVIQAVEKISSSSPLFLQSKLHTGTIVLLSCPEK
ncbi:class I SAM-dependent methyltransferase [Oscillatoria salina]|uniref:class I SAM-dependent methyltransferase n=1 Tax=Oscillatoria salina TaxID=331517 RepID=UPI0013B90506|nr:methyltransferase domain-containing protein [Oscillatoria salina]MBZ8182376.1 methyltransferase domain-containing protein [Oscillatoria salina IIICB1]NET90155.1 methyltransferase domain-containing protein [Kamptonema sp. SIO1D9]